MEQLSNLDFSAETNLVFLPLVKRPLCHLQFCVLDYGDNLYAHASLTLIVCALRFITGGAFLTHNCIQYEKVGVLFNDFAIYLLGCAKKKKNKTNQ